MARVRSCWTLLLFAVLCSLGNCLSLRGRPPQHTRPFEAVTSIRQQVDGLNDTTGALTNICECQCCFEAAPGREECYSTSALSFEVNTCGKCDASQCSSVFHAACSASSSLIKALCVQRSAWYVSGLPALFIAFTAVLVLWGLLPNNPFPADAYQYTEIREGRPSVLAKALGALRDVEPAEKEEGGAAGSADRS